MIGMVGASHYRDDVFFYVNGGGGKISTRVKPTFREDMEYFQFLYLILTSLAFQRAGPRKKGGPDAKVIGVSIRGVRYGDSPILTFALATLHPAFGAAGGTHAASTIFSRPNLHRPR